MNSLLYIANFSHKHICRERKQHFISLCHNIADHQRHIRTYISSNRLTRIPRIPFIHFADWVARTEDEIFSQRNYSILLGFWSLQSFSHFLHGERERETQTFHALVLVTASLFIWFQNINKCDVSNESDTFTHNTHGTHTHQCHTRRINDVI